MERLRRPSDVDEGTNRIDWYARREVSIRGLRRSIEVGEVERASRPVRRIGLTRTVG